MTRNKVIGLAIVGAAAGLLYAVFRDTHEHGLSYWRILLFVVLFWLLATLFGVAIHRWSRRA